MSATVYGLDGRKVRKPKAKKRPTLTARERQKLEQIQIEEKVEASLATIRGWLDRIEDAAQGSDFTWQDANDLDFWAHAIPSLGQAILCRRRA